MFGILFMSRFWLSKCTRFCVFSDRLCLLVWTHGQNQEHRQQKPNVIKFDRFDEDPWKAKIIICFIHSVWARTKLSFIWGLGRNPTRID